MSGTSPPYHVDQAAVAEPLVAIAGITGSVSIDSNGDRNGDYSLLDMNPKTGTFQVRASLEITTAPFSLFSDAFVCIFLHIHIPGSCRYVHLNTADTFSLV